jgi:prepilin-type N-terminal cleavage/methylation domain-containing protein
MHNPTSHRSGFTIIEILVAVGIVGVLMGVLVPAVQQARERSRDLSCRNNLKQVGLALHEHESAHQAFPTAKNCQRRLAPILQQAGMERVGVWKCPSDPYDPTGIENYSYLANDGTRFRGYERNGFLMTPFSELVHGDRDARSADIHDGLSQTAAFSERLLNRRDDKSLSESQLKSDPKRYLWYVPHSYQDEGSLAQACRAERTTPAPCNFPTSLVWADTGYDHILPPNSLGCQNAAAGALFSPDFTSSLVPATSLHDGHVNVLCCDGAVHSIADEIDLKVWQAIGTREGNDQAEIGL